MKQAVVSLTELLAKKRWDPRSCLGTAAHADGEQFGGQQTMAIGELVRERREQSKPTTNPSESFVYVGLENVESATGDIVGETTRKGGEVLSTSKHFRRGDVLFSRLRPNLNKVCCPPFDQGYCSGEFIVLVPVTDVTTARVLREQLSLPAVVQRLKDLVAGATLPRVATTDLLELRVPVVDRKQLAVLTQRLLKEDAKRARWKKDLEEHPARLAQLISATSIARSSSR